MLSKWAVGLDQVRRKFSSHDPSFLNSAAAFSEAFLLWQGAALCAVRAPSWTSAGFGVDKCLEWRCRMCLVWARPSSFLLLLLHLCPCHCGVCHLTALNRCAACTLWRRKGQFPVAWWVWWDGNTFFEAMSRLGVCSVPCSVLFSLLCDS